MSEPILMPPVWRIVAAFVLTPPICAFAIGILSQSSSNGYFNANAAAFVGVIGTVFVAYPIAIVVGVPVFFLLRKRLRASAVNCMLAGILVLAVPLFAMRVYDGLARDLLSPAKVLVLLASLAPFGAVAGLVFWLIAAAGAKQAA